ncbi:hypothetical protein J3R82DRAFT_11354 [Butyriboletus roseoflavus]|nr:hypothetical protein J3R82DRAFT_11354 [Butyriboletus roseoflavus]
MGLTRTYQKLLSSKIDMSASNLPAFLWEEIGQNFNDDNMFKGMFQGFFLEHVICHIYTSPLTSLGDNSLGTHACNADLYKMEKFEVAHIAYGCVQVGLHP